MPKTLRSARHQRFLARLISLRKAKGMTQAQVAEKLGRPQSFVAKYEGGERRLDIIEFLDVTVVLEADPCEILLSLRS
ncbi:MAG: helix-turn-helix domain-containing protein [Mesorhizobium sp.]|uniref:helix-turn-helix domain-containing protein n=1 Tax=unclassified Mesorhizobium TaxID=325217 RepID=UPI000F7502EE|nr:MULTISPECIES: helix-turn-helix transcriptional regulator [unclassified Mesorhizobium]RVC74504.1 helix-turn-helix domain-containing protein [Mesorhizobium sp. M2A.F.Ca.ET.046.02.1.1]AZO34144.1 XRE family transcriptional regulator [Mesorhizobium sp. M2A.F.Ca.ET.046.03.2.1]AZO71572.1 XRE family transcriptional regulator [Mesorhizobium sp. M1D.F.Ca.ET.043.01.1.1]RWB49851.1 MAG: helix-turn-helix domain-containing protein [Mesorhizobium sp.]RWD00900.1 MAG: helix-turn-helix domain-containing prote